MEEGGEVVHVDQDREKVEDQEYGLHPGLPLGDQFLDQTEKKEDESGEEKREERDVREAMEMMK